MTLFGTGLELFALCGAGAAVLYFRQKTSGHAVVGFLVHINGRFARTTNGKLLEAALFTMVGALVSGVLTQPSNPPQALAAGLGWTGLLSSFQRMGDSDGDQQ